MSRSGYTEDCDDNWVLIKYRGQVSSAIRGKRGQEFLRELIDALNAMPEKRLIRGELRHDGEVCALGSVGAKRGVDLENLDPDDHVSLSRIFGVAQQLVQEVEWVNDDAGPAMESPENRWSRMREWAAKNLKETLAA